MGVKVRVLKLVVIVALVAIIAPVGGSNITISEQEGNQEPIPPEKGIILDDDDWHKINDTQIFDAHRENPNEIKNWSDSSVQKYEEEAWEYNIEPYERIDLISGMNRSRVKEIQKRFDFIYETTFPTMTYPEHNETAAEHPYRGNEYDLDEIYFYEFQNFTEQYLGNLSVSNRTEDSPPPRSGKYIKDAHSTIVGVPGSATVKTTSEKFNGERIVPENGRVFVYMDYRVQINESTQCELVAEDRRVCREEKFESTSIKKHTVKFSTTKNSTITYLGDTQSGVSSYCCIAGHREVSFTTLAKPKVVVNVSKSEYQRKTTEDGEYQWVQVSQSYREETETLTVQDHLTAYRLGNTTVRQQVFEGGSAFEGTYQGTENQIDISFKRNGSGIPNSTAEDITPFMWQKLHFSNGGTIKNVWQVYSAADNQSALMYYSEKNESGAGEENGGGSSSSSGGSVRKVEKIDGPVFPDLYVAPTQAKPLMSGIEASLHPEDSNIARFSTYKLDKHENNVLTWANNTETYGSFYLMNDRAEIEYATDIAGNKIPVNTSYWDIGSPTMDVFGRNYDNLYEGRRFGSIETGIDPGEDGRVMLVLWEWGPDDYSQDPWAEDAPYIPLRHETLDLQGTVRNTATTTERGIVVIRPVERKVKISYKGWNVIGHTGDIGKGKASPHYYDHIHQRIGSKVWYFDVKTERADPSTLVSAFVNRIRLVVGFVVLLLPMYWTARALRK
jgi:hypothetical protein